MKRFDPEKKSDRHRKKQFYNEIRQQIEFYLGDVNLSKDRFFSQLLEESPHIDVNLILNCNKIKKLTTKPEDIVKALKTSSLLSVTEDGTKIFRTVPVTLVSNADESTIYVEDLPLEADHDWLKNVFGVYGEILYVSIPRYKTSRKMKGFAFIQFDSPESVKKAIEAFQSADSCLSSSMAPQKLRSIQTFEGDKEIVVREREAPTIEKMKRLQVSSNVVEQEDEEPKRKKRKKNEQNASNEDANTTVNFDEKEESSPMKLKTEMEVSQSDEKMSEAEKSKEETDTENTYEKKHKRRNRKKKKKNEAVQTYGMQILSKLDWKKLRNKYLEEQRKKMHELKEQLQKASRNKLEKCKAKQEEENENSDNISTDEKKPSEFRVKFTPGVIVKLQLDSPIKDPKQFKNEVKRYTDVEYIDVNEKNSCVYLRCLTNDAANQVIALNRWPNMMILHGDEESAYWEKIKLDRKEKFEKKITCNTRGKNKLLKKMETALATHIKFVD